MKDQERIAALESLLALAIRYLEHPDVTAINFSIGSHAVADRIREAVDIDEIERRRSLR